MGGPDAAYTFMRETLSACDAWEILSNTPQLNGLPTTQFWNGSMSARHGGRYGTAMNTPIFIAAYRHLLQSDAWKRHDWLVKLDVDTVVMVRTLRELLRKLDAAHPLVLAGSRDGMRADELTSPVLGPIIPVSRGAYGLLRSGLDTCARSIRYADKGEDHWFGLCAEHLGLTSLAVPGLIRPGPFMPAVEFCRTTVSASFHGRPLKGSDAYSRCARLARGALACKDSVSFQDCNGPPASAMCARARAWQSSSVPWATCTPRDDAALWWMDNCRNSCRLCSSAREVRDGVDEGGWRARALARHNGTRNPTGEPRRRPTMQTDTKDAREATKAAAVPVPAPHEASKVKFDTRRQSRRSEPRKKSILEQGLSNLGELLGLGTEAPAKTHAQGGFCLTACATPTSQWLEQGLSKSYMEHGFGSMSKYAAQHDDVFFHPVMHQSNTEQHCNVDRVRLTQKILAAPGSLCDWVVWLEGDTIITNYSVHPRQFVVQAELQQAAKGLPSPELIFSRDITGRLNSGVGLIRRSDVASHLMARAIRMQDENRSHGLIQAFDHQASPQ